MGLKRKKEKRKLLIRLYRKAFIQYTSLVYNSKILIKKEKKSIQQYCENYNIVQ